MSAYKGKVKISDENVYGLIGVTITCVPLFLLILIKIITNINSNQPIFNNLMTASDWSIVSGMIYLTLLLNLIESIQGRKYDSLRFTATLLRLIILMIINFIVYAVANIYINLQFIGLIQGILFINAIIQFFRYQKAFYLIKKGYGKYNGD